MDGFYGNNSSKVPKLKSFNADVSPINAKRDHEQFFIGPGRYHQPPKSPSFDSYASAGSINLENAGSPLIRYLRSVSPAASAGDTFKTPAAEPSQYRAMIGHQYHGSNNNSSGGSGFGSRGSSFRSPLSALENLESPPSRSQSVFKTPAKVEEDVLVMDGILVGSVSGARVRSSSSDSGGSSSSWSNSFYKTETCRSWEDSGTCLYGPKCQFAHGKEELRPTRFPNKNKSEFQTCKSYTSSGSCTYGSKCRFVHHQVPSMKSSPTEPAVALATTQTVSPIELKQGTNGGSSSSITFTSTDWSPQDDGIEVALPPSASPDKTPSNEEVDAYIHSVLYGPSGRKRLPVFAEICPE